MKFVDITGKSIPELLRGFRQSQNLTQEEIAHKYGLTTRSYKRWESGDASPRFLDFEDFFVDFVAYISCVAHDFIHRNLSLQKHTEK